MKKYKKDLKKYIQQTQKQGFSVKEISDALLSAGWTEEQIKEGFKLASKKSFAVKYFVWLSKAKENLFNSLSHKNKEKHTELMTLDSSLPKKYEDHNLLVVDDVNNRKSAVEKKHPTHKRSKKYKKKNNVLASKAKKEEKKEFSKRKTKSKESVLVSLFLFIPRIIYRIPIEIKEIIKGDIIFIKKFAKRVAVESVKEFGVVKKEPKLISNNLHLLWHYFVELTERGLKLMEAVFISIIRGVMVPFVLVGIFFKNIQERRFNLKKNKKGIKPKMFSFDKDKEYTVRDISSGHFSEKISLLDVLRLAKRMFETRRLRTFLTILGMGVGIGAILFLVSLGYGLQNVLFERITSEDALLVVDAYPPSEDVNIVIDDNMVSQMENLSGVDKVGKMLSVSGGISSESLSVVSTINILDANFRSMSVDRFLEGDFSDDGVVVSAATAMLLGFEDDPKKAIGSLISPFILIQSGEGEFIDTYNIEEKFQITGIVDNFSDSFAYFPMEKMDTSKLNSYSQLKVKAKDADLVNSIKDEVVAFGLQVAALSDTLEQAKKIFGIARIVLGVFGIITLVVSAIGMLNTMTIALLERTQEIGIMKSIGASNLDVWKLFLAESVIMGFLGGVGGVVIGYSASEIFNYGINLLAQTFGGQALDLFQQPLWFVLTIMIFAAVVGLLTGFMPARRAAKLDPLMALKS